MPCSQAASADLCSCTIVWAACQSPTASRSTARFRSWSSRLTHHLPHHDPPRNARLSSRYREDHDLKRARSEEHTSELQSPYDIVCRLLLEKKKKSLTSNRT